MNHLSIGKKPKEAKAPTPTIEDPYGLKSEVKAVIDDMCYNSSESPYGKYLISHENADIDLPNKLTEIINNYLNKNTNGSNT